MSAFVLLGLNAALHAQAGGAGATANYNPSGYSADLIMQEIENPHPDLTMVVAHRGLHSLVDGSFPTIPENSLVSIGLAAQNSLEMVEVDLKLTYDGVPILSHDDNWGRELCNTGGFFSFSQFDPFQPPSNSSNAALNPAVNSWSLGYLRSGVDPPFLRDSATIATSGSVAACTVPGAYGTYAPTLQEVLNYMTQNRIAMVLTLDIKDQATAAAAWQVVACTDESVPCTYDYLGNSYANTTLFKIAARNFKTTAAVEQTFAAGPGPSAAHLFPYFGTANIAPGVFGSGPSGGESPITQTIYAYETDPNLHVSAVEVDLKQPNGILTLTTDFAKTNSNTGGTERVGNFSPYVEYWDPSDPGHTTPEFFSKYGYCCETLADYYFNGSPYGLPSDTDDQRASQPFILSNNFTIITADDAINWVQTLKGLGLRVTKYLISPGGGSSDSGSSGGGSSDSGSNALGPQARLMPLGDSITWGAQSSTGNGYRSVLRTSMLSQGFGADLVGEQSSGSMADNYNEGWSGYTISQIAGIANNALTLYQPNVITLMAGTEDMSQSYQVSTAPSSLSSLISQTLQAAPGAAIAVANLPPSTDPTVEANIQNFNTQIPGIVQQFQSQGQHVALADMSAVTTADLADTVHPNDGGYQKIANAFNAAVVQMIGNGWVTPAVPCANSGAGCNNAALGAGALPASSSPDQLISVANPNALPPGMTGVPVPAQRVAYFDEWSIYANGFYPKALDTEGIAGKLTALNYAFENIDPVNLTCLAANHAAGTDSTDPTAYDGASDAWGDYEMGYTSANSVDGSTDTWGQPLEGNFNQLKELKVKYPNLKILMSLGGWTYSKFFSDVAATQASRQKFVSSCIDMYINGNLPVLSGSPAGGQGVAAGIFDGFDIDWESPNDPAANVGNHYGPQDTANFTLLLAEFRNELNALGGEHYLLTAALPAGPSNINNIQVGQIAQYLDWADIMAYDMHGAFETNGPTNFQAPLFDSPSSPAFGSGLTVNDAISHYLDFGFPSSQINLGIPFYGRGWTGVPANATYGLYQSVNGATNAFPFSQQPGVADYKELESAGEFNNIYFDETVDSTWAYDGTNFYSIETPYSIAYKLQYMQSKGLGGVMMFSLEDDDASTTLVNSATGNIP
jgi:GH18 family chitinase/lysophospholipase L1-like esterase